MSAVAGASRALALWVAVCAAAGCVITPPGGADGGADAGGGDAAAQTIGDQCAAIDAEFCSQAINRCGLVGFTQADCVSNNMSQCCTGSTCSKASAFPQSAVSQCTMDIDVEDCNAIVNSTTPQSCQALLHQQ